MKKLYEEPTLEVTKFVFDVDFLTASIVEGEETLPQGGGGDVGEGGDDPLGGL